MSRYEIYLHFFMNYSESGNFKSCADDVAVQIKSIPDPDRAMPPIFRIGSQVSPLDLALYLTY
ncbi:protein of unknown function [Legionella fallonii LLAP-10]|uniref:Uncharacterized protein n=1 Tax=Legionella fallonii LLAP-10 TaxID=1212491 RepID=A0A098G0G2_9GAMM|nr:protein of unknown function [Legionella fallonii LLAP-10]